MVCEGPGTAREQSDTLLHTSLADALEHRPYILTGRIFADDDWQVARASLSRKDQKQFFRDRKVVALMLLDEIRFRAGQIIYPPPDNRARGC